MVRRRSLARMLTAAATAALAAGVPRFADAFCGFYVSGADASLFNNASLVVLMREGVRTVLSMQNNYQGPPQNFAMVVPVPVVLSEDNVRTLPPEIFSRVDQLAAPRLVEYWEQDPCPQPMPVPAPSKMESEVVTLAGAMEDREESSARKLGVKIEARFKVGEYDVVILGAEDSMGLDTWLRLQHYKIPPGAEPFLRPYVRAGMKFFVAKVDVKKVRFQNGQAMLSPLRFHYDSDSFALPVRLGLVNSAGTQDLIVHVLARGVRYEVANYENYAIPTNLDVAEKAKDSFGAFYAALFDRMLALHPKAVITEYAWDSGNCDPCPTDPLTPAELGTLGADVLPSVADRMDDEDGVDPVLMENFVLTRMHVRYGKDSFGQDLVFRAAPAIEGGRGIPDQNGSLPRAIQTGGINNFQGRYVIKHPWTGPIACEHPQRGIWGGPPSGVAVPIGRGATPALNLAFAPRGNTDLKSLLAGAVPEIEGVDGASQLPHGPVKLPDIPSVHGGGCAACALVDPDDGLPLGLAASAVLVGVYVARRSRRQRLAQRSGGGKS